MNGQSTFLMIQTILVRILVMLAIMANYPSMWNAGYTAFCPNTENVGLDTKSNSTLSVSIS